MAEQLYSTVQVYLINWTQNSNIISNFSFWVQKASRMNFQNESGHLKWDRNLGLCQNRRGLSEQAALQYNTYLDPSACLISVLTEDNFIYFSSSLCCISCCCPELLCFLVVNPVPNV